jgi:hypothetical protein
VSPPSRHTYTHRNHTRATHTHTHTHHKSTSSLTAFCSTSVLDPGDSKLCFSFPFPSPDPATPQFSFRNYSEAPCTYRRSAALYLLVLAVHLHIVFATYAPCIAQPLLCMATSHRLAIATTSHRTRAALSTHRSASPCGCGRAPTVALLLCTCWSLQCICTSSSPPTRHASHSRCFAWPPVIA